MSYNCVIFHYLGSMLLNIMFFSTNCHASEQGSIDIVVSRAQVIHDVWNNNNNKIIIIKTFINESAY